MLGLVSLSVSPDAKYALYNTIEGLTSLWDLTTGDIVGKYESYNRSSGGGDVEPCELSSPPLYSLFTHQEQHGLYL